MQELDPRIIRVGIEVNGNIKTYEGLAIRASGTKYTNANQNDADITIYNLDKSTQDFILTQTNPYNFNRTPKSVRIEAGRKSYGASLIYEGNIIGSKPSQPPDIGVTLKCLTGNFAGGRVISRSFPGLISLQQVANMAAADLSRTLVFQTQNRNLANYAYTGSALGQITHLGTVGGINAFIDNANLIIKSIGVPVNNSTRIVNLHSGMIGIPEMTERGIKVKFLLDNKTTLGGGLQVVSQVYPAANGTYMIYKLAFDISNRDIPFYWIAEGLRI